jgi:hypothetical protein
MGAFLGAAAEDAPMPKRSDIDSVLIIGAGPIYHHRDTEGFEWVAKACRCRFSQADVRIHVGLLFNFNTPVLKNGIKRLVL